ncbi:hypothetical protein [Tautonia plasticadhaerens]|uniref:Uncharacterized protein n=1 Tax=Tautonia plasticadhaerens TaxID=2527974 RepID=A0A518HEM2_9BACT|nr:hypothetical protein [Tautonia plasticadhaerens]QDV39309.1 hypothetical protein ElP_72730 [Tautonia plasticadhaerens]
MTGSRSSMLIAAVGFTGWLTVAGLAPATEVAGIVTFGGEPLATGRVIFHLDDGEFVGSKVRDGKYSVSRVPAGQWRITIEGESIPPRYSSEDRSGLVAAIREGSNTIDLDLAGQSRPHPSTAGDHPLDIKPVQADSPLMPRFQISAWSHPAATRNTGGFIAPTYGAYILDTRRGKVWLVKEGGKPKPLGSVEQQTPSP